MDKVQREAFRKSASEALTRLNDALAREIGPAEPAQVAEYIENYEFGLALELIVLLIIDCGLDGRAYKGDVEALFKKMKMDDSEYASKWRKHLGEA